MNLSYLDLPGEGRPCVVLHREATSPVEDAEILRSTGVVGRTVVPFGDYAFYPSGMAIGGLCWYRLLPGFAGTDPVSLAKAVVQVCDLLDAAAIDGLVLAGFGQGAVVALGAGSIRPDRVSSVVAVDPHPGHLPLLPAATWEVTSAPPVLLAGSGPDGAPALERSLTELAGFGRPATGWCWEGNGGAEAAASELATAVRRWLTGTLPA